MPARFIPLANDEFYHVFNRGVAKLPIFHTKRDYQRFLFTLDYYRFREPPMKLSYFFQLSVEDRNKLLDSLYKNADTLIELYCYCLMPNHYHMLMRQVTDGGISLFFRRIQDSYTKYLNIKIDRVGPLFQGTFKAVRITKDEQFLHVSRYIHVNPFTAFIVHQKDIWEYPWSSLRFYVDQAIPTFVNTSFILDQFQISQTYRKFIEDQISFKKTIKNIQHLTLEKDP